MTKSLDEQAQDLSREAQAISDDVLGFRKKVLTERPGFSYAKLQADDPELYKSLRRVEAKIIKAEGLGKSIFLRIKLNERWWDLLYQGLVKQEQFEPEIQRMRQIYLKAIAH